MKESYGDLRELKKLGNILEYPFTTCQLLDEELKNKGGESRKEVTKRVFTSFNKILSNNFGKKIAIVSHGAVLKFLLIKWCTLNKDKDLEYKGKVVKLNSPSVVRLIFNDNLIKDISQIF